MIRYKKLLLTAACFIGIVLMIVGFYFLYEYNEYRNSYEGVAYPPMLYFNQEIYFPVTSWLLSTDELTLVGEVEGSLSQNEPPKKEKESNFAKVGATIYEGPANNIIVQTGRNSYMLCEKSGQLSDSFEVETIDMKNNERHLYKTPHQEVHSVNSDNYNKIISAGRNFIFDYMLNQEHLTLDFEVTSLDQYYILRNVSSDKSFEEYYLFSLEGTPYLQNQSTGLYKKVNEELYNQLIESIETFEYIKAYS